MAAAFGFLILASRTAVAGVVLNTNDPLANFNKEGNQGFTTGPGSLRLDDASNNDFINFFANDSDAAPGIETDIFVSFQVITSVPNNADNGVRFAINNGQEHAVIAACITKNGIRGIGLARGNQFADPNNYPDKAFVQVNWLAPTTLRVRRTAQGDGEIVEVNGVAPNPRAILLEAELAPPVRSPSTVEFGCRSAEAQATVEINEFFSERVGGVAGTLTFTDFRIRDANSGEQIRFRADFALGSASDGIDPSTQQVTIRLSTSSGQFYPAPSSDFNPLSGFDVHGNDPRRRWSLADAEKARTGLERFDIDENRGSTGATSLADRNADVGSVNFSTVNVQITIGEDQLSGTAELVEHPAGSGRWRLR
jgi:hypothetical protein